MPAPVREDNGAEELVGGVGQKNGGLRKASLELFDDATVLGQHLL